MRQVDDFAVAVPNERIGRILFDLIDEHLTFPLKRMGLIDLFNGLDIEQTRDYIKISARTYIERVCAKHITSWMNLKGSPPQPTPLPCKPKFMRNFLAAEGDPNEKTQRKLARDAGFG